MPGITSLGMGSNAGLTGKTIKKLRTSDEKMIVKPIETKIDDYNQKKDSIKQLLTVIRQAKDFSSSLRDDLLYLKRDVTVNGEGVTASVEGGVEPQTANITVQQLAKGHIIQSDTFASKTASIADEDTHLTIKVGKSTYDFDIKAGTQLRDFVGELSSRTGKDLSASILQTGKDEFRLVLTDKKEGTENRIEMIQGTKPSTKDVERTVKLPLPIEIDPLTGENLPQKYKDKKFTETVKEPGTKLLKNLDNTLVEPQDAKFTYNGANIVRSSNTVDDMVVGLTFNLDQVTDENKQVILDIHPDYSEVAQQMQGFVKAYNVLMADIDSMTKYDPENKEVGIFVADNSINGIRSGLNKIITTPNQEGQALAQLGVSFNQDGTMEFDATTFQGALMGDGDAVEDFFKGKNETKNGKDLQKEGLFYKITEFLDDLDNSADGSIVNFDKTLDRELKRSKTEKKTAIKRLDDKYATMANQFAAADSAIGKAKQSFGSVDMQIRQSQASR